MKAFSVAYRTGGTIECKWTRVLESYPDRAAAEAVKAAIEKGGRKANVYETASLDAIGLPIGWDPKYVNYDRDEITITKFQTSHSAGLKGKK